MHTAQARRATSARDSCRDRERGPGRFGDSTLGMCDCDSSAAGCMRASLAVGGLERVCPRTGPASLLWAVASVGGASWSVVPGLINGWLRGVSCKTLRRRVYERRLPGTRAKAAATSCKPKRIGGGKAAAPASVGRERETVDKVRVPFLFFNVGHTESAGRSGQRIRVTAATM